MAMRADLIEELFAMSRPRILVATALNVARNYKRSRDLPGAVPGLLSKPDDEILPRLVETESQFEEARRAKSPGYRPGRHVQVLAALLAESQADASAPG
ncbi:MAG: DUF6477 family protein [Pseudomonadota bacterium]